jgi:hypothetical protein
LVRRHTSAKHLAPNSYFLRTTNANFSATLLPMPLGLWKSKWEILREDMARRDADWREERAGAEEKWNEERVVAES